MIRLRRGRIVLISSVVGLYGSPGQVNYAASKAGLVGIARSITRELGGRGITANVVAPGLRRDRHDRGRCPRTPGGLPQAAIPAGRFAQADEVARLVRFLASDAAGVHQRRGACRSTAASAWATDLGNYVSATEAPWVCSTAGRCWSPGSSRTPRSPSTWPGWPRRRARTSS